MNQTEYIKERQPLRRQQASLVRFRTHLVKTLEVLVTSQSLQPRAVPMLTIQGQIIEQHRYDCPCRYGAWCHCPAVKPDGRLKLDRIGGFPWNMIMEG